MDPQRRRTLEVQVSTMLEGAWRQPGFCVPNPATYPHQWLWDSCFHSLIWLALDDDRAVTELEHVMAGHDPETGFVPHMTYWADPSESDGFWGQRGSSTITQPPMFGHAAARILASGRSLPEPVVAAMALAYRHLLVDRPRTPAGLVPVFHPWETGCDDSPRWDDLRRADRTWPETKADLVADIARAGGVASGRPPVVAEPTTAPFSVGSVGFNSLIVWNLRELAAALAEPGTPHADSARVLAALVPTADALAAAVAERWRPDDRTGGIWIDDGPPSGRARTLDALLALLIDPRPEAFEQLVDPEGFGAARGPCGVDRREPSYDPVTYWRGPAWPQLTYLLWVAASAADRDDIADTLAEALVDGALTSGLAEYWHPDSGAGLGARPQSWAGLALVVG